MNPPAQPLLLLVKIKYFKNGVLCVIFVEVVFGTAVPSVQVGTRSVIIVAKLGSLSNAAWVVKMWPLDV